MPIKKPNRWKSYVLEDPSVRESIRSSAQLMMDTGQRLIDLTKFDRRKLTDSERRIVKQENKDREDRLERQRRKEESEKSYREAAERRYKAENAFWRGIKESKTKEQIKAEKQAEKNIAERKAKAEKENDDYFENVWKQTHGSDVEKVINTISASMPNSAMSITAKAAGEFAYDKFARALYNTQQMLGSGLHNSTQAHIGALEGDIDMADVDILSAQAHQTVQKRNALQQLFDQEQQRLNQTTGNKDYSTLISLSELLSKLQNDIDNNPAYQGNNLDTLDKMYKQKQVEDHHGSKIGRGIWDNIRSIGILDSLTQELRRNIQRQRLDEDAAEYDASVENWSKLNDYNLSQKLQKAGVIDSKGNALSSPKEQPSIQESTKVTGGLAKKDNDALKANKTVYSKQIGFVDRDKEQRDSEITNSYINTKQQYVRDLRNQILGVYDLLNSFDKFTERSKTWKLMESVTQDSSIFSKDYWLYLVPGMIGSSNSSPEQIMSNALQYATMAGGPLTGALGYIASMPGQLKGAQDENLAEISERRSSNIKNYLSQDEFKNTSKYIIADLTEKDKKYWKAQGMTDEWVEEHLSDENNLYRDLASGRIDNNSTIVRNALLCSLKGLKAQYDADMMRTAGELPVQFALNILPADKMIRSIGGWARKKALNVADKYIPNGEKVVSGVAERGARVRKGKYNNDLGIIDSFSKGYEAASETAQTLGYGFAGQVEYGILGGTARSAAHVAKKVAQRFSSDGAWVDAMQTAMSNKYVNILEKLTPEKEWLKLALAYGLKGGAKMLRSSLSEGAEEGVQYLNSKKDFATTYGYNGMMLGDMIANDMEMGDKIKDAYLSLLGLGHSELWDDQEFVLNYKGGFVLGGPNPGFTSVNQVYKGLNNIRKEASAAEAIKQTAIMDREIDKMNRTANVTFAKLAMQKKGDASIAVLERMRDHDAMKENPEFQPEDYEQLIEDARRVNAKVNDKDTRAKLEAKGFVYGTEEYANAIADICNLESQISAAKDESESIQGELNNHYSSAPFTQKVNEAVNRHMKDQESSGDSQLLKLIVRATSEEEKRLIDQAKKSGIDTNTEEFKQQVHESQQIVEQQVHDQYRRNYLSVIVDNTKVFNRAKSLLKLRAQNNTANDVFEFIERSTGLRTKRPDAKFIKDSVDAEIASLKERISKIDPSFKKDASDAELLDFINQYEHQINMETDDDVCDLEAASFMANIEGGIAARYLNQFTSTDGKDRYHDRVKAIMAANERNQKLDWIVNDIYTGDAVTKYQEQVNKEQAEELAKKAKESKPKSTIRPTVTPTEKAIADIDKRIQVRKEQKSAKLSENKRKYQKRVEEAKKAYKRRAGHKMFKTTNGQIIPVTSFAMLANKLMKLSQIGVYKFAQFVQDVQDIIEARLDEQSLKNAKEAYIKQSIKLELKNPEAAKNLSTAEEVIAYISEGNPTKRAYITPIAKTSTYGETVQRVLQDRERKINKELSTYYDTVVEDETGTVIYPNTAEIELRNLSADKVELQNQISTEVNEAIKSEDTFEQLIDKYKLSHGYLKLKSVNGVTDLISRAVFNKLNEHNEYVIFGMAVRDYFTALISGNTELAQQIESNNKDYNFKALKDYIRNLLQSLPEKGLQPVLVNSNLYGRDKDGNNVSSQLDLALVNNQGELYVIDVLSSVANIHNGWDKVAPTKSYTRGEREIAMLHQLQWLLLNEGFTVKSLSVIPVNRISKDIEVENRIQVKLDDSVSTEDTIEDLAERSKTVTDKLNSLIDLYNEKANSVKGTSKLSKRDYTECETIDEYKSLIDTITQQYDDIHNLLDDLNKLIYQLMQAEQQDWVDSFDAQHQPDFTENEESKTAKQLLDELVDSCASLDMLMDHLTSLVPKTQKEKELVKNFLVDIILAQETLNNFLMYPEAQTINIEAEERLITAAIELVVSNPQVYGEQGEVVKKWWINNFAIGVSGNTIQTVDNVYDKYTCYSNSLKTWVSAVRQHIINDDMDKRQDLQSWYSTILNNYFSKLLENAQKFVEQSNLDYVQVSTLQESINKGYSMIQYFNDEWGVQPDEKYSGPAKDEVERINRMPIKWKDLYEVSSLHSPSNTELSKNPIYYYMSIEPNFPANAKYEFREENGEIVVYIYTDDRYKYSAKNRFTFIDDPNSYPKQYRSRIKHVNRANRKFINKIKSMLDYVKDHPEYKMSFESVSANNGGVNYDSNNALHSVLDFLFNDTDNTHDLYTVRTGLKSHIGIVENTNVKRNGKDITIFGVHGGPNMQPMNEFSPKYLKREHPGINSGQFVYNFSTGNNVRVSVPLINSKVINPQQIVKLLKMLVNGEQYIDGYNIYDLLDMQLYMAYTGQHLTFNNYTNTLVEIVNGVVKIGNDTYDITAQIRELTDRITKMSMHINKDLIDDNLQSSKNSVLNKVASIFANNSSINEVTLPNGMKFTRDDFTHKNQDGTVGSTYLGYLMRNGLMQTMAVSRKFRLINFGNPLLVPVTTDLAGTVEEMISSAEQSKTYTADQYIDMLNDLAGLQISQESSNIQQMSDEQFESFKDIATEYFNKVLGKYGWDASKAFEMELLKVPGSSKVAVGICSASYIGLSKYAPREAIYHEAFHKILELTLPESERERFYQMYRDKYDKDGLMTDRDVAEDLCDMFTSYMYDKMAAKNASGLNKIYKWFKHIIFNMGMVLKLGALNAYKVHKFYSDINKGVYANREITEEAKQRFEDRFGEGLHYEILNRDTGIKANFEHMSNISDVQDMARFIGYLITKEFGMDDFKFNPSKIKINSNLAYRLLHLSTVGRYLLMFMGNNVQGLPMFPAIKEIFSDTSIRNILDKDGKPSVGKDGKVLTEIYYPKFEAISRYVADYLATLIGDYDGKIKDELSDDEDDEYLKTNIDKFDRASYEFNKIDSVTSRVKCFFSTIVYRGDDGKVDITKNKFGVPTYMPLEEVYNIIVNDFNDVSSISDLMYKLLKMSTKTPMHNEVYQRLNRIYSEMYKDGKIDYDKEAFMVQVFSCIKSQKIDFVAAISKSNGTSKSISIKSSSVERDSRMYPSQWTNFLVTGLVPIFKETRDVTGNLIFKEGKQNTFDNIASFFDDIITACNTSSDTKTIAGIEYNINNVVDVIKLKQEIVRQLNSIGIMISMESINHMLVNGFGGLTFDSISSWINSKSESSVTAFITRLRLFTDKNGNINQKLAKEGFINIGFVKQLGNWVGEYNKATTQLMVPAFNGKRFYTVSLNSSISHMVNQFNSMNPENSLIKTLTRFGYNCTDLNGVRMGSIILKNILNGISQHISIHTYIGFKTDTRGDYGTEYTKEPTVEDYLAKMSMLQEGYLIAPTTADKGTWVILSGVHVPGMTFNQSTVENQPTVIYVGDKFMLRPHDTVLKLMIEYALTEKLAIEQCIEDLKDPNKLPDSAKIKNYHTKNGQGVEPNGTRFLSLTLITILEDGKLKTINLNDPNMSSEDCLNLAKKYFFNKTSEEQYEIMTYTLATLTEEAVKNAIKLGLVSRKSIMPNGSTEEFVRATDEGIANLTSTQLNQKQIDILAQKLFDNDPVWSKEKDVNNIVAYMEVCRSLAIAAILGDVTNRSIISSQEFHRCFIGHPALFKVKYDRKIGKIKDSTFDLQKRIGGIISTGDDNVTDLPGLSEDYVCAEIKDYEVGSTSSIVPRLEQMFVNGAIRDLYGNVTGNYVEAYDQDDIEKLKKVLVDEYMSPEELDKIINEAKSCAEAFNDGINVADGAAYITADVCENMLRMRGAYSENIKRAFDILRGEESSSWMDKQNAFNKIYNAVNIVTTKYTAYGFRDHISNGNQVTDVSVAYYNKFALFPLFPCLATGKMGLIYQKMLNEKVDMLMMDSAVKVGSQGAIGYGHNHTIDEMLNTPFNTYVQKFAFLRRQLNTDPEEGESMHVGTQAVKIGLLNLRLFRQNYNVNGQLMSGEDLLTKFMNHIKMISKQGSEKLINKFFTDDKFDESKLSKYLEDQLSSRNANTATLEAIRMGSDGRMKSVLAATADSQWIESILISEVNKLVIDINMPGNSFVQRSVFAMEGENGEGTIKGMNTYHGQKLLMINEDGSMDAVISIDYFESILPKGLSFSEARQWLIDNKIIGPDAKANTLAYRIPTLAQSSIHGLRFLDVCPAVKCTIILPEEFTKITGSDKQYQCSNQYNIKNRFNCWELLNQLRQSAAKSLLDYVCRERFND